MSGIGISLVDVLIVIKENGTIETVNPATERLFGYGSEELVGRSVKMLMNDFDQDNHDSHPDLSSQAGKGKLVSIAPREVMARRKDGTMFPLDPSISELWVGGTQKFIGVVRDFSERKRAEDELRIARDEAEAANQAKSKFMALMSHELCTPLNAIIRFSEILANQSMGPIENDKYREYVEDIHFSGEHLLELINDILELVNIDAGTTDLDENIINIEKLTNSVFAMMEDQADANGIELEIHTPDNLPALRADERKLTLILVNLINNTVKF